MTLLRVIYLDRNMLTHVGALEGCVALDTLNVTSNQIHRLDFLPHSLATFNAAGNNLCTEAALQPLKACQSLTVLDLSDNHIGPSLLPFFRHMPTLRVLYLQVPHPVVMSFLVAVVVWVPNPNPTPEPVGCRGVRGCEAELTLTHTGKPHHQAARIPPPSGVRTHGFDLSG
jgi:hypothetical protein